MRSRDGRNMRRRSIGVGPLACAAAVALGLSAFCTPAFAKVVHKYLFNFESSSAPGATFESLQGLAVDNSSSASSEDVYVALGTGSLVDKFKASGEYACQITGAGSSSTSPSECDLTGTAAPSGTVGLDFGVAIGATGKVYVPNLLGGSVNVFSPEGSWLSAPAIEQSFPAHLALDAAGDVYVTSLFNTIVKYEAGSGVSVPFASGTSFDAISGIAVDDASASPALGDVYVADNVAGVVYVFNPKGELQATLTGPPGAKFTTPGGIAVDLGTGNVYVTDESAGVVDEFAPGGSSFVSQIAMPGTKPKPVAVAVANNGDVYVGDSTGKVIDVFGPGAIVPDATLGSPTGVQETRVTLHGEVDPSGGGNVTSCVFEYGETTPTQSVSCSPATPYTTKTAVQASVEGLTPSTTYRYRLKVENASGTSESEEGTVSTAGRPGAGKTWTVAGPDTATLNGEINPFGYETSCKVQYVTEAAFAANGYEHSITAPCEPETLAAGFGMQKTIARVAGLQENTSYVYRFVVANSAGTTTGANGTFATFGFARFTAGLLNEESGPFTQAGGHPFSLNTEIAFNTTSFDNGVLTPSGTVKDVRVELPPGVAGAPDAVGQCSQYDAERFQCAPDTEIGVMEVEEAETIDGKSPRHVFIGPLFNLKAPAGVAARFSARFNDVANAYIDATVRTGEDYGVTAAGLNITAIKAIARVSVHVWGVPGAASHENERYCPYPASLGKISYQSPPCSSNLPEVPFLRAPTSCSPLNATVSADSYQAPGEYANKTAAIPTMKGCGKLQFKPTLSVAPESTSADSPSGLEVKLHVPQEETAGGLAEADLRDATVLLPDGVTVNPSAANGLRGCPQEGSEGINLHSSEPGRCPDAAKIGKVELETPLFPHRVFNGGVYVAQQSSNPFGSLLAIYLAIDEPETGVVIKLAGHVQLDQRTGQLTTTFDENPQLPFEELRLKFFGGPRASLATPRSCGTYQVTSMFEPWSHQPAEGESEGTQDAESLSSFQITSGPGGSACGGSGFSPGFSAGTASNQAGGFGAFQMNVTRNDGEQHFSTVSMHMPNGVAALLAKVPLCGEAQANAGNCPPASKIGHVTASAGVGSEPGDLPEAGKPEDPVYLTGSYDGAPFGLSIVVPAEAGPFNLGTVVVRAKIEVNPHTAQVSVVSDPMPTMLQGVPLDVRSIDVTVDRPEFVFNPTSCEPMSVTGSIGSAEGATAAVSSRFQAAGCRGLPFTPTFSVSTHKGHTKRNGAYLHVKVTSSSGQANIKSVFVELPKILPSRDETLKMACSEKQFAANPAGCPAGSQVGDAIAHTPVLPVPLSGPAIFVSHGGAGFPDLDVVLQGDGVTVDLEGNTNIVKKITSSDFKSVPDVPISSFELTLPESSHSALAAEGNLCFQIVRKRVKTTVQGKTVYHTRQVRQRRAMIMPTTITGQNGAVVEQATKIAVEGCAKPKSKISRARGRRRLGSPRGG